MIEIDVSRSDNVHFPAGQCCNCGTQAGSIGVVKTTLHGTLYRSNRSQLKATLPLPYCTQCRKTAFRAAKGFGIRLFVWICLSILGLILAEELGSGRILSTDRRDFNSYRWKNRKPFKNLLVLD